MIHIEIVRQTTQVLNYRALLKVSFDNSQNSLICFAVLSTLLCLTFASNIFFILLVSILLRCLQSINEMPDSRMIHAQSLLHSFVGSLGIVVCAIIIVQDPIIQVPKH
jgi:hypothetical protein